jgi:RNA polymerase subunit RPABC4/transcription elongation factor Spt4
LTFQRSLEEEYLLQDLEANVACPHCNRAISEEFIVCPHCHSRLQEGCVNCGREFDVRWSLCPYCGHEKGAALTEIRPVVQPIERFVQSGPEPTVRELPTARAIEELEAQAFYRLETPEQPAAIASTSGRAFDRRKTREMHRAKSMNGRTDAVSTPNGNGPAEDHDGETDEPETADVGHGQADSDD